MIRDRRRGGRAGADAGRAGARQRPAAARSAASASQPVSASGEPAGRRRQRWRARRRSSASRHSFTSTALPIASGDAMANLTIADAPRDAAGASPTAGSGPQRTAMRHLTVSALALSAALAASLAAAGSARAEEGMWTFDRILFPIARANQALGTRIDQAWLDKVRLSSVKFERLLWPVHFRRSRAKDLVIHHCVATCVANSITTQAVNGQRARPASPTPRNTRGRGEMPRERRPRS